MSLVPATHPTAADLIAFGQGKLPADAVDAVARHVETCDACRQAVDAVPADSFAGLVKGAHAKGATALPAAASKFGASDSLMGRATTPAPPHGLPPELADHPRFRVVRELGRGGMGVVYQAEHKMMERQVAIKVISKSVLDHPEALARFEGEVRAAAKLKHPNIVAAYDAERAGDLHMLVMEYVDGVDLAKVLKRKGPLPILNACHYVRQAALGLKHAHEEGMVHRDVKPQNLMLTPKGQVKVLDFGLARLASERKGAGLTQDGAFMGTPEYVSPEQATDARTADIRADIYSLGCTLYALLAGRPPFAGEATPMKQVLAHIEKEAAPLSEVRPEVPAELSAVVARMLAKDPARRYQTPGDVAQALTPFCKAAPKEAAPAAPPGRDTRLGGDTGSEKALPFKKRVDHARPKTADKRRPSSGNGNRWAVLVAAGLALPLLLAGIILVIKWTKKDGSSTEVTLKFGGDNANPGAKAGEGGVKPAAGEGDGFVSLFDGKERKEWQASKFNVEGLCTVEDGVLVLSAKEGKVARFETRRAYSDFHLRVEAMNIPGKNKTLDLRTAVEVKECYAVSFGGETYDAPLEHLAIGSFVRETGEIRRADWLQPRNRVSVKDYAWFRLEVVARANKIVVKVEGENVLEYEDVGVPWKSGKIRLAAGGSTPLRIRKIEIKELPPTKPTDRK